MLPTSSLPEDETSPAADWTQSRSDFKQQMAKVQAEVVCAERGGGHTFQKAAGSAVKQSDLSHLRETYLTEARSPGAAL